VGAFADETVKELAGLPEAAKVVALTPLGRPAEQPAARTRKAPEELFSWNRFGQPLPLPW
jgi:hypothetical protein